MYKDIVNILTDKKLTVTFAESCTGGWLAKSLTDIPGSSAVFAGSVVSYSNEVKQRLLGVRAETLDDFGAVSKQTAREMALGAASLFNADIAIGVTGIAGPEGGTPDKPVGLVFVGIYKRGSISVHRLQIGDGDALRSVIRRTVVRLVADYIKEAAESL